MADVNTPPPTDADEKKVVLGEDGQVICGTLRARIFLHVRVPSCCLSVPSPFVCEMAVPGSGHWCECLVALRQTKSILTFPSFSTFISCISSDAGISATTVLHSRCLCREFSLSRRMRKRSSRRQWKRKRKRRQRRLPRLPRLRFCSFSPCSAFLFLPLPPHDKFRTNASCVVLADS